MNPERLLAHFETISEAPDAIARLRRFILDLAVRGKLVEQDPEDEPAEDQLERIILAKLERARKQRGSSKNLRENGLDSLAYDLPPGWVSASLADLVTILNGRAYKQGELLDSGTPVLRVGNLFTSNKWYYSDLELEDDKYIDDGDLIFAWSASFGPFVWRGGRVIYHYHIWKLLLHSPHDLSRDYLCLYLQHKTDEIKGAGHGISMVHMTKEKMELLEVPLPPLAEQHRIVAKVDELMALCDQLQAARQQREQQRERLMAASLQRLNQPSEDSPSFRNDARFALQVLPSLTTTPAHIKQLRQTILNLAVRGKLVEQDPEDEPAEHVIGETGFQLAPTWTIPSSWAWVRLMDLGRLKGGGTPSKARDDFWDGDIPWVSPKDMKVDYVQDAQMSITQVAIKQSAVNLIGPGSILFVVRGMILAHSFPVAVCRALVTINQDMKALVPHNVEMSEYLLRALKGLKPEMLMKVQRSSHGTCRIEGKDYSEFPIPLPPLAEQHRIVAKVDELMALCDQLEQQLNQAEQQRRRLLEALLAEALNGRLDAEGESHADAA